jgi:site-specific DNA-adenine methylase
MTATAGKVYKAIEIPMGYAGKKDKSLGFMINHLTNQFNYKVFADIFGGSGQALMNVDIKEGVKEYINDFDPLIHNYYVVISDYCQSFIDLGKRIQNDLQSCNLNSVEYKEGLKLLISNETEHQQNTPDPAVKYAKAVFCYYDSVCKGFKAVNRASVEAAFALCFCHQFLFSGNDPSISAVDDRHIKKFVKSNLDDWKAVSTRLQGVEKLSEDAIKLLVRPDINTADTLCYSDSPYISTKQYKRTGNFGMPEMKSLLRNLRDFEGKFIFSCRAAAKKPVKNDGKEEGELDSFFEMPASNIPEVEKERRNILEVLHYFLEIHQGTNEKPARPLWVYYKLDSKCDDLITQIIYSINNNQIFEIMISDLDVEVPECRDYSEAVEDSGDFGKVPYDVFYSGTGEKYKHERGVHSVNSLGVQHQLSVFSDNEYEFGKLDS